MRRFPLALGMAVVLLVLFALPAAAAAPSGSYTQTCTDIKMSGDTLHATCNMMNGTPNQTQLDNANGCTGDVGNVNGILVCTGAVGSYYKTCKNVRIEGSTLYGTCQRRDGSWKDTSLANFKGFQGAIANCDGNLQNGECS